MPGLNRIRTIHPSWRGSLWVGLCRTRTQHYLLAAHWGACEKPFLALGLSFPLSEWLLEISGRSPQQFPCIQGMVLAKCSPGYPFCACLPTSMWRARVRGHYICLKCGPSKEGEARDSPYSPGSFQVSEAGLRSGSCWKLPQLPVPWP